MYRNTNHCIATVLIWLNVNILIWCRNELSTKLWYFRTFWCLNSISISILILLCFIKVSKVHNHYILELFNTIRVYWIETNITCSYWITTLILQYVKFSIEMFLVVRYQLWNAPSFYLLIFNLLLAFVILLNHFQDFLPPFLHQIL